MKPASLILRAAVILVAVSCALAADEAVRTQVTYYTGSTIYIDAGLDDNLVVGSVLTVMRGDEVVATCRVGEASSHKATCAILQNLSAPQAGDTVVFRAEEAEPEPVEPVVTSRSRRRGGSGLLRSIGLRGRVGVRYLWVQDQMDGGVDYAQPSADVRISGAHIGGSPWGVDIDARARRTTRNLADGSTEDDRRTRVYRAAFSRRGVDDPWGFTAGRQFVPAIAAVSVFDGLSAELVHPRWSAGAFSGSQPDPVDYGLSTDIREHGGWFQFRSKPGARRRYEMTTGLIGSYQESEVNREFAYLQGRVFGPKLSVYVTQEVDYNRGWKVDAGESTLSMTSTFASVNYRVGSRLMLRGGYDNRRNVRLYRDFITPEIEFDDNYRRGVWGGLSARLGERYSTGFDVRTNGGGAAGTSSVYTGTFGVRNVFERLDVRARTTRYENDVEEGWLYSLTTGLEFGRVVRLQLGGGLRDETSLVLTSPDEQLVWMNAEIDVFLGRHWYVIVSLDRSDGNQEKYSQYYSGITYRF